MEINRATGSDQLQRYATQSKQLTNKKEVSDNKAAESGGVIKDKVELSNEALAAMANEKSDQKEPASRTETIIKMSDAERAELVAKLKEEQEKNMSKMFDFVRDTLAAQGTTFAQTDDMWKFIASGEYTVDEATKTEAQAAIAEDGFYGVKQTSERIFEFALALTGGDEKQMKKMEEAIAEGFKAAEEAWGGKLPSITEETNAAIKQKFEDYYASLKPQAE